MTESNRKGQQDHSRENDTYASSTGPGPGPHRTLAFPTTVGQRHGASSSDLASGDSMEDVFDSSFSPSKNPIREIGFTVLVAFVLLLEQRYLGLLKWVMYPCGVIVLFMVFHEFMFDLYLFRSRSEDEAACLKSSVQKTTVYANWRAIRPYRICLALLLVLVPFASDFTTPWGAVTAIVAHTFYADRTLFRPIAVLFLGNSNDDSLSVLYEAGMGASPYKVASLLRMATDERLPFSKERRPVPHSYRLRFCGKYRNDWKKAVSELCRGAAILVVDVRVSTPFVVYETALALAPDAREKTLIVTGAGETHPALEEALASDPDLVVSPEQIISAEEVRERVKARVEHLMGRAKQEWKAGRPSD